jgi:thiol-disulfide isomerase/thioredoxin
METREDFKNYLRDSECETTIIKFGATWCTPCQKIKPTIKALNEQCKKMNKVYNYIDLDVDECPDIYAFLKQKKMVRGIPVLFCYKKCQYSDSSFYAPCDSITGASVQDIVNFYKRNIS